MTDLQMLGLLESLVRLSLAGALPSAALTAVASTHRGAREELARLNNAMAVEGLRLNLESKKTGAIFVPSVVGRAATLLADPKRAAWLVEVGRLASSSS